MADEAGFRQYVTLRQRALLQTAWLLTGDWAGAEDLVQATLLTMWGRWGRISTGRDHASLDGYARRVLLSTYLGWRRRRWHGERPTQVLPDTVVPAPDSYEVRHVMADAVRSLPPRQRAVIVLRYFEDLTERDTAAALDCSVGTVKSQTSKALATLRRHPDLTGLDLEGSPA